MIILLQGTNTYPIRSYIIWTWKDTKDTRESFIQSNESMRMPDHGYRMTFGLKTTFIKGLTKPQFIPIGPFGDLLYHIFFCILFIKAYPDSDFLNYKSNSKTINIKSISEFLSNECCWTSFPILFPFA